MLPIAAEGWGFILIPLAVALDLLAVLVVARWTRLETAVLFSRGAWALLGVVWFSSRWFFWPRVQRDLLLAFLTHNPIGGVVGATLVAAVRRCGRRRRRRSGAVGFDRPSDRCRCRRRRWYRFDHAHIRRGAAEDLPPPLPRLYYRQHHLRAVAQVQLV